MSKWTRRYDLLALQWSNIPLAIVRSPLIKDPGAKLLVGELLSWAWKDGGRCAPSQEVIAWHLSTTVRTVQRWLKTLKAVGLIKIVDRRNKNLPNEIIFVKNLEKFCTAERLDNRRKIFGPAMEAELEAKMTSRQNVVSLPTPASGGVTSRHGHREPPDTGIVSLPMPASYEVHQGKHRREADASYKTSRRAKRVAFSAASTASVSKKKSSRARNIGLVAVRGENSVKGAMKGNSVFATSEEVVDLPAGELVRVPEKTFDISKKNAEKKNAETLRERSGKGGEHDADPPRRSRTDRLLAKGWAKLDEAQKCATCRELTTWVDPEKNIRHPRTGCRLPAPAEKKPKARDKGDSGQKDAKAPPPPAYGPSGVQLRKSAKTMTPVAYTIEFFYTAYEDKWGDLPKRPNFTQKEIGLINSVLLKKYDLASIEKMARVLCLDWEAMRDSFWKARDRSSKPTFTDFLDMHDFLFGSIDEGVTSQQNRMSDYVAWMETHCPPKPKTGKKSKQKAEKATKKGKRTFGEILGESKHPW